MPNHAPAILRDHAVEAAALRAEAALECRVYLRLAWRALRRWLSFLLLGAGPR